jgi:cysteine-rich repeat protein
VPARHLACAFVGAVIVISSVATCVSSDVEECANGLICPAGTKCFVLDNGRTACGLVAPFCGDGRIDDILDEACDDGLAGQSGDGCTSRCTAELAIWRQLVETHPSSKTGNRMLYGLATDPVTGLLLFGGANGSGSLIGLPPIFEDTWTWNGAAWTEADVLEDISGAMQRPPRRNEPSIAYDPGRERVVLFGGIGDGGLLGDTFEWDGYTWRTFAVPGPSPRQGASMACSPGRCILFGGKGAGDTLLADAWEWDGASWTELAVPGGPGARANAVMTYDRGRARFVVFGGERPVGGGSAAETWELDDTGWQMLASTPAPWPPTRPYPAGAYDEIDARTIVLIPASGNSQTWFYDGSWGSGSGSGQPNISDFVALGTESSGRVVFGSSLLETLHRWEGSGWARVTPFPLPGIAHLSAAYDLRRGRTIVTSRVGLVTRTHEWNGRGWLAVRDEPAHEGNVATAIVYDAACGAVVGFGGPTGTAWTYDGTWQDTGSGGPPARLDHAMTYDAGRDAVLVFGGTDTATQGTVFDDFWELRGPCGQKTWTRIEGPGPSAREGASMVYDAGRDVVVLFGGRDASGAFLRDTWEWKQGVWTNVTEPDAPAPRAFHAMAFSPRLRRVVLVGGENDAGASNDSWQWDGTAWQEIKTITAPDRLTRFALAPDITGGLFAVLNTTLKDKVVRLSFENPTQPVERCLGNVDEDGDGLAGCDDPDCRLRCAPACPVDTLFADCASGPRCGDGVASAIETYLLCPADVAPP